MNNNNFTALVRNMRQAQKDYFRTRQPGFLQLSRNYEKQVDAALASAQDGPGLFDPELWKPTDAQLHAFRKLADCNPLEGYEWEILEEFWQDLVKLARQ